VGQDSTSATNSFQLVVNEHLEAGRMIRSTNSEQESYGCLEEASSLVAKTLLGVETREHLTRATMEPLVILCLLAIIYISVNAIQLPAGELMVLIAIFYRLSPRMVTLQQIIQRLTACLPIFTSVSELVQRFDASSDLWKGALFTDLKIGIHLNKVNLKLEGIWILRDLDLKVSALKTTALVGPSGSGKSTVLDILTGLRLPDGGAVEIDGMSLSEIDLASFRNAIGYAHQENGFFHDTVRNNILFFEPRLSDEEIWQVLELTNAAEFLTLKQGLDTVVGDQGIRLSGGQRQRLALARALARHPKILLLDEPTSALDADAKAVILETLTKLRGSMTIILVTHDKELASEADVVYNFG
jgi:ATP-binding cassette subfamily C protein